MLEGLRKFLSGLVLAALLASPGSSFAAEPTLALEYVYPDQSIWTTRQTPAGTPDNPLLRYAEKLFARAGLPFRANAYPSARMFNMLRSDPGAVSILVDSPTVRDCCLLSSAPVARTDIMAYHLDTLPPLKGLDDLKGKHLILLRGYSYGDLGPILKSSANGLQIDLAASHETAFGMLERGRGDYLLDYAGPAGEVLTDHPVARLSWQRLSRSEVHLVISKHYPGAAEIMKRLENAAATLPKVELLGKEMN